jgi:hypothetical protein
MSEPAPDVPPVNPANPDPELFYELLSIRTWALHHIAKPDSLSTPLYCVEKHETLSKKKPDIIIHSGGSKSGPVLGVVRLGLREYAIGLGDPDALLEEGDRNERVVWECLRRSNKWNHKAYEFEWDHGVGGGERTNYKWQWTSRGFLGVHSDLELRVSSPDSREGDIVVLYKRANWRHPKRGSFFIKRGFGNGEKEAKKWELMVLLTALGIIEGLVRRSRG